MAKRNCAYTGQESTCSDKALPRELAGDEVHNWTSILPASKDYKDSKGDDLPTDIEAEIHETFYMLEIYRWKVKFLELKLSKLQERNHRKPQKKTGIAKKLKEKIKQKQIETAIQVKEVIEDNEEKIQNFLDSKKKSLF